MDAVEILKALEEMYPEAAAELEFSNPFETLIATILSAQCTDRRVNMVTRELFRAYPDSRAMATLTPEQLEPMIKTCGLYRMKAKNIIATCRALVENYSGEVPNTREELMKLPGVGQKTAGVVLLAAFGKDQIPVDTHVFRVANRLGLVDEPTPEKTEAALKRALPREKWSHSHHLLIWHGRRCCHARKPECETCPLSVGCKYFLGQTEVE
ncbi:MAG: endonuclease III [Clostridia bacterium]|nr:endonuclease III [Clostridia bacterium]